jgi:diphthine synthase
MLWFVGLGVCPPESIPAAAARILESADITYLETFTSPVAPAAGVADARPAPRWMVEDGREILDNAERSTVALASYGDPMVATTHAELRARAISRGIRTGVVHASSVASVVFGECGLHHYKAGRTATIMDDPKATLTPYQTTYRNAVSGNHTLLLLEYDAGRGFFLDPGAALGMMQEAEAGQRRGVFAGDAYVVVASRVGMPDQAIRAGQLDSMKLLDYGKPPHSIVVPGPLHFTERDALMALAECGDEPPPEGQTIQSIPHQMMQKYAPAVLRAADGIPDSDRHHTVLENARLYVRDAERALEEGHDEVAVLSIGYADGLVDALRIQLNLGEWSTDTKM